MTTPRTTADALAEFDALEPVAVEFMFGDWRGEGVPTGHPMDGVLEAYHWHGKRFESAEVVHPLVFRAAGGGKVYVHPKALTPGLMWSRLLPVPRSPLVGRAFQSLLRGMATSKPQARLEVRECRGKTGAAMAYNGVPIVDYFRRLDDDTVLGLMDLDGMDQPFFFLLRRELPDA